MYIIDKLCQLEEDNVLQNSGITLSKSYDIRLIFFYLLKSF